MPSIVGYREGPSAPFGQWGTSVFPGGWGHEFPTDTSEKLDKLERAGEQSFLQGERRTAFQALQIMCRVQLQVLLLYSRHLCAWGRCHLYSCSQCPLGSRTDLGSCLCHCYSPLPPQPPGVTRSCGCTRGVKILVVEQLREELKHFQTLFWAERGLNGHLERTSHLPISLACCTSLFGASRL